VIGPDIGILAQKIASNVQSILIMMKASKCVHLVQLHNQYGMDQFVLDVQIINSLIQQQKDAFRVLQD